MISFVNSFINSWSNGLSLLIKLAFPKLYLKLYDGFKAELKKTSNEILIYDKYNFDLNLNNSEIYNNSDMNTYNLTKLIKDKNYKIINQRIVDSLLLLTLIFLITNQLLINLKFTLPDLISIISFAIIIIFIDNMLGNLNISNSLITLLMYLNIIFPLFIVLRLKKI